MKFQSVFFFSLSSAFLQAGVDGFLSPYSSAIAAAHRQASSSVSIARCRPFSDRLSSGHRMSETVDDETYSWSPKKAAEFVTFNKGSPEETGMILSAMITTWTGKDLADFLTRLYLGRRDPETFNIVIDEKNVQDPQWKGLRPSGVDALRDLLLSALPDHLLEPQEIVRCAESFLLRKHEWRSFDGMETKESASFASLGHSEGFGKAFCRIREKRLGLFSVEDVVSMLTLPEHGDKSIIPLELTDFFLSLGIRLSSRERAAVVPGLAAAGWHPAAIGLFVCNIKLEVSEKKEKNGTPLPLSLNKAYYLQEVMENNPYKKVIENLMLPSAKL